MKLKDYKVNEEKEKFEVVKHQLDKFRGIDYHMFHCENKYDSITFVIKDESIPNLLDDQVELQTVALIEAMTNMDWYYITSGYGYSLATKLDGVLVGVNDLLEIFTRGTLLDMELYEIHRNRK